MSKNIILLSDGTGNSAAKFNKTNVWRTYEALDLSDPKKQVAFYDDGVGTSSFRALALVTGAIGIGLSRNVRELYAFLCRNYKPGDRIYGFGFSRGAFTIRTLAGFVCRYGLINVDDCDGDRDLWKKTTWLYQKYRKNCTGTGTLPYPAWIIRGLRDSFATKAKRKFLKQHETFMKENEESLKKPESLPAELEKNFRNAGVEFLGLWDTVDAYGLPVEELTMGWDRFVWPLSMSNRDLNSKVKKAVHALSLDDERNSFHPLLWNEVGKSDVADVSTVIRQPAGAGSIAEERLSQVWFAGMHANVGGGYPDDFLSQAPLNFVLGQLEGKTPSPMRNSLVGEVFFDKEIRQAQRNAARVMGVMHDSRAGLGSYYRYLPRKLEKLLTSARWATRFWKDRKRESFKTNVVGIECPKIHHSVFERIGEIGLRYSPIVLPAKYAVVGRNGGVAMQAPHELEAETKRANAQERVWDIVWWRRVTYFSTLFVTGILALLPWISFPPSVGAWLPLEVKINAGKCISSYFCTLSGIPKFFGAFLPSYANTWLDSFTANPGYFIVLSAIVVALMRISSRLDAKIDDRMLSIWHPGPAGLPLGDYTSRVYRFRTGERYQRWLLNFKQRILPTLFGGSALAAIVLVLVSGASRIWFSAVDSYGAHCKVESRSMPSSTLPIFSGPRIFNPSQPCWPSGMEAKQGASYRVVIDISGTQGNWKDGALKADLQGNVESHWPWTAIAAWPAKRYLRENYYKPVARIRTRVKSWSAGQDEYVLAPTFLSSEGSYHCLVSDFTAQSTGELFLFVNDAIIYGTPNGVTPTYENNGGMAEVYVKRIASIGEPFALPPGMSNTSACKEFVFTPP